jgi:uncharacterized membrane protein YkoI
MTPKVWKSAAGVAGLAACALIGATVAAGAGSGTKNAAASTTTATSTTAKAPRTPETPLSGDTLAKVTAAAIARVGGTVDFATSENDGSDAAAAYEAHVTKADGSRVTVILDSSFAVLAVETGHGPPPDGRFGGRGPHGGPGGGNGETDLTGDVAAKAKAKAAAVAKTGGTADRATTENDSSNAAAAYEVHVTKTDGTHVTVILDKDDTVLSIETRPEHGGPGHP